ncbi:hypothetical protein [Corynebacterium ammoniagenes]|uniref:Uncharacterized protein n=1 Tax=Corynebacterium ammoniagenes DSM 20306 TaxID=649754 RepID=A0ABN0ABZ3_CORAM|nr:hypothetical protein [Corynebacterium ammoniagenes]APT82156.1 hypothetical protein CAMM_04225 [Corynebacterium ammoniagenes DSM 20306]AQS73253.1 hypothetical protein CA40472_04550 [Corynebacterium ammoniagenes]EFG80285.1 hypothetical protein HMPREF0281_02379 [Corynebacterium ammoniagenes DSM 20306]
MPTNREQAREELRAYLKELQVDAEGLSDQELALAAFRSASGSVRARNVEEMDDESIVQEAAAEVARMREERRNHTDTPHNC